MHLVIEFIVRKFIEGSTCFERHFARHQELQTVFAVPGSYAHVVTGRSPHVYINCKYSLELLMTNEMPLETCSAFNKFSNNKFYYKMHLVGYFY